MHRLRPPTVALIWGLLLCCGTLDGIDHVHDLRILAVRADPPDQLLTIGASPSLVAPTQQVTVTALVADPNGHGRTIAYSLGTCPQLNTGTGAAAGGGPPFLASTSTATFRCLPTEYQEFANGTTSATDGSVEVTGMFTASATLLATALERDAYHGLDGLRLPVQLTVQAGTESVVGTKLVVYTIDTGAPYTPNENPLLEGVEVGGVAWAATTPLTLSTAARPSTKGWYIQPLFDASLAVSYQQPSFTGELLSFQEIWSFDYFGTYGGFSPTTAGGQNFASNAPESPNAYWLPDTGTTGPATFWLVARDGRGGESWLVRQAIFTP